MNKRGSSLPNNRLLRIHEVLQLVPVSRATWYQGIKDGIYPAPVRLGKRSVAWRERDIQAILENGVE